MSTAAACQRAAAWLRDLEAALARADIPAVLALFADEECLWRDMVAFTWNIKTMEGKDQIAAFLSATVANTMPSGFRIEGDARELDGVTEARFTFETKLARGRGFLRLKDGRAWTFLTAAPALKGFEEKSGPARDKGVEHGVQRRRTTWLERRTQEEKALGYTEQPLLPHHRRRPGRTGARRQAEAPRRSDPHRREKRARRR
jgi:putative flavoprotein involved in K+ transport